MLSDKIARPADQLMDARLPTYFSSDLLQAMLSNVTDRISIVDHRYRIISTSPAVATAWNLPVDRIIGLRLSDLIGEFNFQDDLKPLVDLALKGTVSQHTFWQSLSDQNQQPRDLSYIDYKCTPYRVADKIVGVIINVQDLTDIQTAQQGHLETQQRLIDFANSTSDWFWEMDHKLRFTWISDQIESKFHMDRNTLYGKPRPESPHNKAEAQAWSEHKKQLARQEPFRDFCYRVNTQLGVRWACTSGVPVFNDKGQFRGYRGTATDVTDIKAFEQQARQIERRFTRAIDEFPGSFALYDHNNRLVAYNRKFEEIHSFLGKDLKQGLKFEHCQQKRLAAGLVEQALGREPQWLAERLQKFNHPDGPIEVLSNRNTWLRVTEQRLPDGGCLQTMVDITADKNNELAIKEERNLLRALIDNIPDFIYAKDKQARFTIQNRALASFMRSHLNPEQVEKLVPEGSSDFDYYHTHIAKEFHASDMRVIENGESIMHNQKHVLHPDKGEHIWVATSKVPLRDTEGNIIGLVGAGRNISAHKELEAELRGSQERFRDFAETAADLFWELDADLRITYVSKRCKELTGIAPERLIGNSYRSIKMYNSENTRATDQLKQSITQRAAFDGLEITVGERCAPSYLVLSGKPCYDTAGEFRGYRGAGRDITKSRQLESILNHQVSHDDLTDLPNRREFERRLSQTLKQSVYGDRTAVLGYLDLDQFKVINDSVGHLAGDQLLIQVAQLISTQLRDRHTLARLGGDEFGLLFIDCTMEEAVATMERTIRQFEQYRFAWDGRVFGVGASIGLVAITNSNTNESELLSKADVACFAAKGNGRGRVHVYKPSDREMTQRHSDMLLASGIKEAIKNNQFCLFAQPIAALQSDGSGKPSLTVEHYEILLRMRSPTNKLLAPGSFIPAAERRGLMNDIDRWVIANTLEELNRNYSRTGDVRVTINLSGQSLSDDSMADFVKQRLARTSIKPVNLCFEITETAAISNFEKAQNFISVMTSLGCAFALDDFGSGLSSFNYLKHFAVDYLKIDGSFVRDIVSNPTDHVMVSSIHQIGQLLNIKTIAEFVENDDIIRTLSDIGVDYVQGYGVGKPVRFSQCLQQLIEKANTTDTTSCTKLPEYDPA